MVGTIIGDSVSSSLPPPHPPPPPPHPRAFDPSVMIHLWWRFPPVAVPRALTSHTRCCAVFCSISTIVRYATARTGHLWWTAARPGWNFARCVRGWSESRCAVWVFVCVCVCFPFPSPHSTSVRSSREGEGGGGLCFCAQNRRVHKEALLLLYRICGLEKRGWLCEELRSGVG